MRMTVQSADSAFKFIQSNRKRVPHHATSSFEVGWNLPEMLSKDWLVQSAVCGLTKNKRSTASV
jgi:hypothetical protein